MPLCFLDIPVTLQFICLSFLSARTKARFETCCRWNLVLLRELRRRLPQLVASSSKNSAHQVLKDALEKLTARPNLAFIFYDSPRNDWSKAVDNLLPKDTFLLTAHTAAIQSNIDKKVSATGGATVMLGSYPEAYFAHFHLDFSSLPASVGPETKICTSAYKRMKKSLDKQIPITNAGSNHFWKVFIVFPCGNNGTWAVDPILANLQRDYADAAIIGGVCKRGGVRVFGLSECMSRTAASPSSSGQVKFIHSGIVGLALGGNVPIRAVVSRGVKRVSCQRSVVTRSRTVSGKYSLQYIYEVSQAPSASPVSLEKWVGRCIHESGLTPEYVGLRVPDAPGFTLHQLQRHSFGRDEATGKTILRVATKADARGAQIELYRLDGQAIIQDVEATLVRLKRELQAKNAKLMGALMFSCDSRGPEGSDLVNNEKMMDAQRFENRFPSLPLCGCYTQGEIGPRAIYVEHPAKAASAVSMRGGVALQGFTVVFGVFVCPTVLDAKAREFDKLSPSQIQKYFEKDSKLI